MARRQTHCPMSSVGRVGIRSCAMIIDSHTHNSRPGAVVNIDPVTAPVSGFRFEDDRFYSVGIHPWNAGCYTPRDVKRLCRQAHDPRVVAVGEAGLDSVHAMYRWQERGRSKELVQEMPDIDLQMELLMTHIRLSESIGKPLLLHIVKRFPEIQQLRIKLKPSQPWVIHGFRGKPGLASDLLKSGFYLSYGELFNPSSVRITPPGRMLVETDESLTPIENIVASLPVIPAVSLPGLLGHCAADL